MRNRWQRACSRVAIVDHIPDHSIWNRHVFGGTIHSYGDGVTTAKRSGHAAANTGEAEVVAEHWNASVAHAANDGLHFLDLLRTLWTIEQNVVPVRGVKVLDRGQD